MTATTRGVTLVALLAALGRPAWWVLALAGFLVRGGILLFVLAIVALPSPLALSNVLGPLVTPLYLGRLEPGTVGLIAGSVALVLAWLAAGSWFAAVTEVTLIHDARLAAREEGLAVRGDLPGRRLLVSRATAAHLLALAPLALVLGLGSVRILDVAYLELTNPTDASSIVLRVVARSAESVIAIAIAWILGEIVGGLAVRRIVLDDEAAAGAVGRAAFDLIRHPAGSLLAPLVTIGVLAVDLAAVLAVVTLVWTEVRERLVHPLDEPLATVLAVATLGAAWVLALLMTGLIDAWRSAAMTLEAERAAAARDARRRTSGGDAGRPVPRRDQEAEAALDGTIGASAHRRPGDWSADDGGGSL